MKRAALALLVASAGCDRCLARPPPADDASVPQANATVDAAPAKKELVSLIPWTDSRVAVSSTVDNPKDHPEHLIDGKLETAWNGRTGDLAGFIAFRVPREVHVASVQLTAGFDKKDLFTANHRIARVKISRDGAVLKEVDLDVEKRGLQAIAVAQPGGDFEIRIVRTVPGTNEKWKELVVSELVVLGDPGSARRASPHLSRVRVGSLDAPESRFVADEDAGGELGIGPWPSIGAYCQEFTARARERAKKRAVDPTHPCAEIPPPSCGIDARLPVSGAEPFLATAKLWRTDGYVQDSWVALETEQGWWPRMLRLEAADECRLGDVGSESGKTIKVEPITRGAIAIEIEHRLLDPMYSDPETGEPSMWVREQASRVVHACRAIAGNVSCNETHVIGEHSGRLGDQPTPFSRWEDRRGYRLDPIDGGTILLR